MVELSVNCCGIIMQKVGQSETATQWSALRELQIEIQPAFLLAGLSALRELQIEIQPVFLLAGLFGVR